jgi:hypothetical protein
VYVDSDGRLHLTIGQRGGAWFCSEVINSETLGYGAYVFRLASRADTDDPSVVVGLFTWGSAAPQHHYREIDIEFSRWGAAGNDNSQYVVQPYTMPGNMFRFDSQFTQAVTTHGFDWRPERIFFQSLDGNRPFPGLDPLTTWTYSGPDIPPAGGETARINFWPSQGLPPASGSPIDMIVEDFEFIPAGE